MLISALLVLPPLVVSLTGRWGDTAVLALVALAIVLGKRRGPRDAMQLAIPLLLVLLGGAVAVAVALVRARTAIALARFGLLMRLADAADGAAAPRSWSTRCSICSCRRMGDVAIIDAMLGGEQRRIGARVARRASTRRRSRRSAAARRCAGGRAAARGRWPPARPCS